MITPAATARSNSAARQLVDRGVRAVQRFIDAERHQPCEHGHLDCSTWADGPCLNEVEAIADARGMAVQL